MAQLENYIPQLDLGIAPQLSNVAFNGSINGYLVDIVKKSKNNLYLSWEYADLGLGFSSPHWGVNLYSMNTLMIASASFVPQTNAFYNQPLYTRINSLTLTCAGKFTPTLNWGVNLNVQNRNLLKITANYVDDINFDNTYVCGFSEIAGGCSTDFGLLYRPNNNWSFAVVAKDLFSQFIYDYRFSILSLKQPGVLQYECQHAAIPYFITGFAYQQPAWRFTAAGDYSWKSSDRNGNLSLGVEEGLYHWLYFRAGYSKNDDASDAISRCGFGLKTGNFTADIAAMTLFQKWNAAMTVSYRF
jgi:hypothetical protein